MQSNRLNKILFSFFLIVFCQISLLAQAVQQQTEPATYIRENYTKREVKNASAIILPITKK